MDGTLQNENKLVGTLSSGNSIVGGLGTVIARDGKDGAKGDKGDKGDTGPSGVYVGSGDMPEDCNVQIDPNGKTEIYTHYEFYYSEDGSYNEYNQALGDKLRSDYEDNRPFVVTINAREEGCCYPATAHISKNMLGIYAIGYDAFYYMSITMTTNVTKYNSYEIVSTAFNETTNTAATQKATAEWVKAYVDESIVEGAW